MRRLVLVGFVSAGLLIGQIPSTPFYPSMEGRKLTLTEAQKLEQRLQSEPDDTYARRQLLAYYFYHQPTELPTADIQSARRRHIAWFVEHEPTQSMLRDAAGVIEANGGPLADAAGYEQVRRLWQERTSGPGVMAGTLANAGFFFRGVDREFATTALERAAEKEPAALEWQQMLGRQYALNMRGAVGLSQYNMITRIDSAAAAGPLAQRSKQKLDESRNPDLLVAASGIFNSPVRPEWMQKETVPSAALAVQYAQQAKRVAPDHSRLDSPLIMAMYSQYQRRKLARAPQEELRPLLAEFEQAVKDARDPGARRYGMVYLAREMADAGDWAKAGQYGRQLLEPSGQGGNWNSGNERHYGNIVLGRAALQAGDKAAAAQYLLAAGKMAGSPQLNSFGPDFVLAKALVEAGERTAVIQYLRDVQGFWKMNRGLPEKWIGILEAGGKPSFQPMEPPGANSKLIGSVAKDFLLKSADGQEYKLSALAGKVVLLDFWATWCAPCREEMPKLDRIYREAKEKGVVVLGVDAGEDQQTVTDYLAKNPVSYPVVFAPHESGPVADYEAQALPTLVIIDRAGKIADYQRGSSREDRMRPALAKLGVMLAQAAVPPPGTKPTSGIERIGSGVTSPKMQQRTDPSYTDEARRAKVSGKVAASVVIQPDGTVGDVKILLPLGFGLDEAAASAFREWRFLPAQKNGQPVAVEARVETSFRILGIPDTVRLILQRGSDTSRPELLSGNIPQYNGKVPGGACRLSFVVNAEGVPEDLNVTKASDPDWCDKLPREITAWRFKPGQRDRQAVAVPGTLLIGTEDGVQALTREFMAVVR